jgi:TusA-related sulfurtransferase
MTDFRPPRPDRVLDVRGYFCPVPVVRAARTVEEMPAGGILEVRADDRGALADLPDWCAGHGQEFLGWCRDGRHYRLFIRRV